MHLYIVERRRHGPDSRSRSLATDSTIKLIRFQLDGLRRGSCEDNQSADPAACNILIMRRCVGRIARDATEKLHDKSRCNFLGRAQRLLAVATDAFTVARPPYVVD